MMIHTGEIQQFVDRARDMGLCTSLCVARDDVYRTIGYITLELPLLDRQA